MVANEYPGRNPLGPITGSATIEMTSVDFWNGDNIVIMNHSEIEEYNRYLQNEKGTRVIDVLSVPQTIPGEDVVALIEDYQTLEDTVYFADEIATEDMKKALIALEAIETIPHFVNVQYGLISCPADMRSYPTTKAGTGDGSFNSEKCIDQLQGTRLNLAEPVLIYHSSADKKWFFVQSTNYSGWIKRSCVALCPRPIWEDYIQSPRFVIVTEHKTCDVFDVKMNLYVGTKIALDTDGQMRIPTRTIDGGFKFMTTYLDIKTHNGYLPYTTRNVITQAFKLLDDQFSWGGKNGHSDCSGTVDAVYSCFGFTLPRDTCDIRKIKRNAIDQIDTIDYNSVQLGSLLLCPGHVMIYLGVHEGKAYCFHGLASVLDEQGGLVDIYRTEVNPVDLVRSETGRTYEDDMVLIVEIKALNAKDREVKEVE